MWIWGMVLLLFFENISLNDKNKKITNTEQPMPIQIVGFLSNSIKIISSNSLKSICILRSFTKALIVFISILEIRIKKLFKLS